MKKRILQCLSLILCAAMLAIPAAAAETADEEAPARLGPAAYWGTVTWMDEDTFLLDSGKGTAWATRWWSTWGMPPIWTPSPATP